MSYRTSLYFRLRSTSLLLAIIERIVEEIEGPKDWRKDPNLGLNLATGMGAISKKER